MCNRERPELVFDKQYGSFPNPKKISAGRRNS